LDKLPQITYATRREKLNLPGGSSIELELLENLNGTIDQVFEILERAGRPELLEVLCPYFGVVWPSARALTEVLDRGFFIQPGQRTLEIGCGLAIPSLRLAAQGIRVDATDFHPEVPRFLERNRGLSGIPPERLRYHALDWQQDPDGLERFAREHGPFDRIIGSDILYEAKHAELVPQVLDRLLARGGKALIADPARPYLQNFVDGMGRRGFLNRTEILTAEDRPVAKEVFVVEFERK
jgi:predicted nicotinamide N-methyase